MNLEAHSFDRAAGEEFYEWPLLGRAAGTEGVEHAAAAPAAQPFCALVRRIRKGEAVEAFARRRAGQILYTGHTPEQDLEKGIGAIASEAQYRLAALHETVGRHRMNLPPKTRTECLRYIEAAGAVLIALWDRCQTEIPEE